MEQEEKLERFMLGMLACVGEGKENELYKLKGFERFYLYTNEHLAVFLKKIGMEDKRVLTVGSSGDQILYSLMLGANEVVCFDICPFAKEYFELKCACIKSLTFEEYSEWVGEDERILSPKVYAKVSQNLSDQAKAFWDEAYLNGFNHTDFKFNRSNVRLMGNETYMTNKSVYEQLKSRLNSSLPVSFIEMDLREVPEKLPSDEKFDVILLSNIFQYAKRWYPNPIKGELEFCKVVKSLSNHLNTNGVMQIDYAYSNRLEKYKKMRDMLPDGKVASSAVSFKVGPILYKKGAEPEQEERM